MSKRIAVVGGTGTIGGAVVAELRKEGHEVVAVGHSSGDLQVDLGDADSIGEFYQNLGEVDAVVSAAGNATFGSFTELDEEDYLVGFHNKLLGQINLVRLGREHVASDGSFTLVSGILANQPMEGSAAISAANAGVEGFTRAAALELDQRVNCVSPGWVSETLEEMGRDPSNGTRAAVVARVFVASVIGQANGEIFTAVDE